MVAVETASQGVNLGLLLTSVVLALILVSIFGRLRRHLEKLAHAGPIGMRNYLQGIVETTQVVIIKFSHLPKTKTSLVPSDFRPVSAIESHIYVNKWRVCLTLMVLYGIYSVAMIQLFAPVQATEAGYLPIPNNPVWYENYLSIFLLTATNVATDLISLAFTLKHLSLSRDYLVRKDLAKSFYMIMRDLGFAICFFLGSQLISNALYPVSIMGGDVLNLDLIFSSETALKPYGFILPFDATHSVLFTIPGQLFLTGTAFIPTVIYVSIFTVSVVAFAFYFGAVTFLKTQKWSCWHRPDETIFDGITPNNRSTQQLNRQIQCISHLIIGSVGLCIGFIFSIAVGTTSSLIVDVLKASGSA